MAKTRFPGFPLELLHFLDELSRHNNREWFQANRPRYEQALLEPALAFIEAMTESLEKISPHFCALPKRSGGSLMRIYRDVRFGKNKRPYKTNVGIQFRHEAGRDVHAPGFYFHISIDETFLGVGIWRPDSQALRKIRYAIDNHSADWKNVCQNRTFRKRFERRGESLKRPPRGYSADHPLLNDLRRKDHIAICPLEHDTLLTPSIVPETARGYRAGRAYMQFLCDALGLKF